MDEPIRVAGGEWLPGAVGDAHLALLHPAFSPNSPVAILVGAGVSTQVEDEKALGELICAVERMSEGLVLALPSLRPRGGGGGRSKITKSLEPRGGRTPHGTHCVSQGTVFLPSFSTSIRLSERSRNWRYWRSRRFSTCRIWFPARDRKLPGKREG